MHRSRLLLWLTLAVLSLSSCTPDFPPIRDPDKLRSDCVALHKNYPDGEITPEHWPASVAALNPVHVDRDGLMVIIITDSEPGQQPRGYAVTEIGGEPQSHYELTMRYPGIYSFK